jgi:hypothetical protein
MSSTNEIKCHVITQHQATITWNNHLCRWLPSTCLLLHHRAIWRKVTASDADVANKAITLQTKRNKERCR